MKVRISESVGNFDDKVMTAWGLDMWKGIKDPDQDVLFFGLYINHDYDVYWNHEGKKSVFWCGSDILRLLMIPERQRILKLYPEAKHYCENEIEQQELLSVGVKALVRPSFVGDMDEFPVTFKPTTEPHVFLSGHPNREDEYGFNLAERLAEQLPEFTFHLYGAGEPLEKGNLICHGLVPNGQFNEEVKNYHCGLRPNLHDGNSEIAMKSILCGGYPITRIEYPHIWNYNTDEELIKQLKRIKTMKEPNVKGRDFWRKNLNNYPWMKHDRKNV